MAFGEKNLIPTINHDSIMIWECFVAAVTSKILHLDGTMDSVSMKANTQKNVFGKSN